MKNISILSTLLVGMVAMSACTDYNTPVAAPFGYEPEDPAQASITIEAQAYAQPVVITDASADTIDAFTIDLSATPELPSNASFEYTLAMAATEDMNSAVTIPVTINGNTAKIATADLDATVKNLCGSKSQAYTVYSKLTAVIRTSDRCIELFSNTLAATVTPKALPIEGAYYLIGDLPSWDFAAAANWPFSTTDGEIFTITVTVTGLSNWKVAPQSAIDNNDWNIVLGNTLQDQNPELSGTLIANGGSMALPDAGTYVITLDMTSYTYNVTLQ